jgi:hypothetical protein
MSLIPQTSTPGAEPLSLQALCLQAIDRSNIMHQLTGLVFILENTVDLRLCHRCSTAECTICSFGIECQRAVSSKYSTLVDKLGFEQICALIGEEEATLLQNQLDERTKVEKRMASYKGSVVVPVAASPECRDSDGKYPYSALVQGAAWPSDVDPTKRELWLSDSEFVTVFGITKTEYLGKDRFMKERLKKEKKLF